MPHVNSLPATFDPALTAGARNAVHVCLQLQSNERMTLITDRASAEIAAALVVEIEKTGANYNVLVLEEFGPRPHRDMPQPVLDDLAQSQVSIYACITQTGELRTRMQMMDVINPRRIRHGHMVNINKQIMLEGMRADFLEVDRLSQKLIEKCRRAKRVTCKTAAGTDYVAELSPKLNWVKTSGLISPAKWGNLPGGEIFTSPFNSNGRFVVDGVVGDYLCQKYGDIGATPLTIDIKDNRIAGLACSNKELLAEFDKYCQRIRTRTALASLPSAPTSPARTSSGTSCRTKSFPASTSPSAIRIRSTPARRGRARPTSTASAATSTSGSTTSRSWRRANF